MASYYLLALLAIVITSFAQILLKKGANFGKKKGTLLALYLNSFTIIGYLLFVSVTVLNLYYLKYIPLKEMAFIMPVIYVSVPVLSYFLLGERITRRQRFAILTIFVGILIFNLDKFQ